MRFFAALDVGGDQNLRISYFWGRNLYLWLRMGIVDYRPREPAIRMEPASGTRQPDGGYPPDIRDVTDGIGKLRKSYS